MRYASTILIILGVVALAVGRLRAPDKLIARRWFTLGFTLLALGTAWHATNDPGIAPTIVNLLFLSIHVAAGTYFAMRAALPCLVGLHSSSVANRVAAIRDDGEPVTIDVLWPPGATGDREELLSNVLRHGHIVESRCGSCGLLVPRHIKE